MSKASEYAAAHKRRKPEEILFDPGCFGGFTCRAKVAKDGGLKVAREWMSPKEALKFAAWILDTFGETPNE